MFGEALLERVEVFEESVDGVVPSVGCFCFCDGYDAFGWCECSVWCWEVFVCEYEYGFSCPFGSFCDTEDVEASDA